MFAIRSRTFFVSCGMKAKAGVAASGERVPAVHKYTKAKVSFI
jgi:hypothetical protein